MTEFDSQRANYVYFNRINTRWMDNDIYGHVNNVAYYSYFDTVANNFLIEKGGLAIHSADIVGFVVSSNCNYSSPITHPAQLDAAFRVNRLGNSSVQYGIGIFRAGEDEAAAHGTFTHVFVDRRTDQTASIPDPLRTALAGALVQPGA